MQQQSRIVNAKRAREKVRDGGAETVKVGEECGQNGLEVAWAVDGHLIVGEALDCAALPDRATPSSDPARSTSECATAVPTFINIKVVYSSMRVVRRYK